MSTYNSLYNSNNFYGDEIDVTNISAPTIKTDYINEKTSGAGLFLQASRPDLTWDNHNVNVDKYVYIDNLGNISQSGYTNVGVIYAEEGKISDLNVNRLSARHTDFITICKLDPDNGDNISINYIIIDTVNGIITKSGYISKGVLKSLETTGEIISELIKNEDIDDNEIALTKIKKINPYKILGNNTNTINDISEIDFSSNSSNNTIMYRDSSANTQVNQISLNNINSLTNPYLYIKNIKFSDNEITSNSTSDFFIFKENIGDMYLWNFSGDIWIRSESNNINFFSNSASTINHFNDTHIKSPNLLYVDNINEESNNNGVIIDSLHIKDGKIISSTYNVAGVLHNDINGNIYSSLITPPDYNDNSIPIIKIEQIPAYTLLGNNTAITNDVSTINFNVSPLADTIVMRTNDGSVQASSIISNRIISGTYGLENQNSTILMRLYRNSVGVPHYEAFNIGCYVDANPIELIMSVKYDSLNIKFLNTLNGILKNDINGNITSSLITNDNITTNSINLNKLSQIANNKVLGNISGSLADVSLIDVSTSKNPNTIMLRDSNGDTYLNKLYTFYIDSSPYTYLYVKNIKFSDDNIVDETGSNFQIVNRNSGYLILNNEVGKTYLNSDIDDVIIGGGTNKNVIFNNTLKCLTYSTGYLVSDNNGLITSSNVDPVLFDPIKDVTVNNIFAYGSVQTDYIQTYKGLLIENNGEDCHIKIINTNNGDIDIISNEGNILLRTINNYNNISIDTSNLFFMIDRVYFECFKTNNDFLRTDIYGKLYTSNINYSDITIPDNSITLSKIQTVSNNKLLGNISGITGNVSQIDLSSSASNNTIVQRDSLGDIYSNRLVSGAGTVTTPAIILRNGTNSATGIYSDVVDTIKLCTNTTARLQISNSAVSITNCTLSANNSSLTNIVSSDVQNGSGTASAPSYRFSSDTNSGMYSGGADVVRISTGASDRIQCDNTNVSILNATLVSTTSTLTTINNTTTNTTIINNAVGSVTNPSYTFSGDSNTGIYSSAGDNIDFSTNGIKRLNINNSNITSLSTILAPIVQTDPGVVGAPAYSFTFDTDTGIYSSGANSVDITTGGTRRLKIDNSGCYATNLSLDGLSYLGGIFKNGSLTLSIGDSSGGNFASVVCSGKYTRMFDVCFYSFNIGWSGKGTTITTDQCRITGFPYSFSTGNNITSNIANLPVSYTSYPTIAGFASQTYAGIWNQRTGNTDTPVLVSQMPVSITFYVQMTAHVI